MSSWVPLFRLYPGSSRHSPDPVLTIEPWPVACHTSVELPLQSHNSTRLPAPVPVTCMHLPTMWTVPSDCQDQVCACVPLQE